MSDSPTQHPAAPVGTVPSELAHQTAPPFSETSSMSALRVESPSFASAQPMLGHRPTLDLSESTESRTSKMRFPLRPFRSPPRGPVDLQSNNPHPMEERSMSLTDEVEKKRRWPLIRSLAALLGLRSKERAGEPLRIIKEHHSNVKHTDTSTGQSHLFSEIPEVEFPDIDEAAQPVIAKPAPIDILQSQGAFLALSPSPQESLAPGSLMSTPERQQKRRWPLIQSLAAFLRLRPKERAGEPLRIIKEHHSNVKHTDTSAGQSHLVSEIPEVEFPDIDEAARPVIAKPAPIDILQPHGASLALSPSPQESLAPGSLMSTPERQQDSGAPGSSEHATRLNIPQLVVNDSHPPISRQMSAQEVVSRLVERGCEDLSESIDASTFADHPLAIGGLSDIYRGCLTDRKAVAVKALRIAAQQSIGDSPGHLLRAARELHTWSKCKHPNVLPLYGLATFRDRIGMVSPWMSKGTLPQYLTANPDADRRDMCVQICEGLSHMHKTGIIHGDLKGANVLVDDNDNAVLADFGSSTLKDQSLKFSQAASNKALTVRWSAPELVLGNGCQHTKASDVFALGMTIYEVLTGKVPYHEIKDVAPVILRIIQQEKPTQPVSIPGGHTSGDLLWHLFTLCWKYEPRERPSAATVVEMMNAISMEGVIYQVPQAPEPLQKLPTNPSST
ncbi:hypothetical protein RSAG8_04672, partial [Rhizoctonia solani AG-8 WAC10335]